MNGGGDTPQKTLMAVQIVNSGPFVFGYLENGTYYYYIKPQGGNGFLTNNAGLIQYDTGSTLTDQFTTYLISKISQNYEVEYVDVISGKDYAVGQTVPNWDSYVLVNY